MKPLWKVRSGEFAGWRTSDDELYNAAGKHIGYFVDDTAYTNNGHAIGEVHGEQWIGKRKTVIYPTDRQQAERSGKAAAPLPDRPGLPLAGWTDPGL
ncbi:MAG: hypothetical protein JSW71_08650 [Gemmatimonadota bacterium]|nr:MAG: hypothetical protein JSW71_08650 [Gemmatimonadota bacterium]